jgi:hypothetical protein
MSKSAQNLVVCRTGRINLMRKRLVRLIGMFAITLPVLGQTLRPVTTRAFDNSRSGANTSETILTRDKVATKGIRRVTTIPVFGDARGTESQPLILPGVKLKDGSTHDVMILPSMANIVRGVDAETGAGLWQANLGRPIDGGAAIDMHQINDHWGVLSTGVIDPDTKRVYLVAWISPDGTPQKGMQHVCVLNIADGTLVVPPVSLADAKSGTQRFASAMRKQRSSLVMTNVNGTKTVFFASGSVMETAKGSAGWVFAFDVASNRITSSLAMSQGLGAGVWMAGQGLAADAQGFLYGISGNGSYDGVFDFGECVFKIQYQPPIATTAAWMKVIDSWAPFSDAGRIGENPQLSAPKVELAPKLAGVSAPSQEVAMPVGGGMKISIKNTRSVQSGVDETGRAVTLVYPKDPTDPAWSDEDFGSAGGTLIAQYGVYLAAGKDGIGYSVNTQNLGHTQPADFGNAKANCAKLKAPPVWIAASPGPVDPCPQDETTLDFMPWGKTRHVHATPVQYMSPTRGMTIFVWGENSQLHAWTMSPTGALTYLAQGRETASANVTNSPGGMPGGFCSLSSDANKVGTAVLWCSIPYGDGNATVTNGRLLAYDPEDLAANPDGSKSLRVLWDSQQWNIQYLFNKFLPPIVWNGRIYLPNYNGGVDVYALAP